MCLNVQKTFWKTPKNVLNMDSAIQKGESLLYCLILKTYCRDFPGGPVVRTSPSVTGGAGSIPGQGAKIPHASWPKNQNIKQRQYGNKFNTDLKKKKVHGKKILKKIKTSCRYYIYIYIFLRIYILTHMGAQILPFLFIYLFFIFIFGCVGSSFLCEGFL